MRKNKRKNHRDKICITCNLRKVCKVGFHKNGDIKYGNECYSCRGKRKSFRSRNIRGLAISKYNLDVTLCQLCEWKGVCDIHHLDKDRKNNDISNLQIICPNCHRNIHHPL